MFGDEITTIGIVYGFWGQNIGNAFFNLGGRHVLSSIVGPTNIKPIQDQPSYWTFRDESKGNFQNAIGLIDRIGVDGVIVQGPLFTPNFGHIWHSTLTALRDQGRWWAGIGVGMRKYSAAERTAVARVLRMNPPHFLSTRDSETYRFLSSIGLTHTRLHDGIDSAFYAPLYYRPPALDVGDPILALTFDHYPEPRLTASAAGDLSLPSGRFREDYSVLGDRIADKGKAGGLFYQLVSPRHRPVGIGGARIVRPNHRTNPHLPNLIYRSPNAIASDEPYTYLTIYSNAWLTLSDRVHACVATLAYGNPAKLHNPSTKRSALFERVGCDKINQSAQTLSRDFIDTEFSRMCLFIESSLADT